jgi:hypothetical protein
MVETFKTKILRFFASDYLSMLEKKEKDINNEVNIRVAKIISQMDPFEPLLKEYHGVFSEEFERVEDKLDEGSRISMAMWANMQAKDPHMQRMIQWVMDSAGNDTMKRAPISVERTQYGRAQIANMILWKREIRRLSSIYEDILKKGRGSEDFDENLSID